jgi:hypothetical protein
MIEGQRAATVPYGDDITIREWGNELNLMALPSVTAFGAWRV